MEVLEVPAQRVVAVAEWLALDSRLLDGAVHALDSGHWSTGDQALMPPADRRATLQFAAVG